MSDMAGAMSGNGFGAVLAVLSEGEEVRPLVTLAQQQSFRSELSSLLNRYSRENGSDTPDFILADYLLQSLDTFDLVTRNRDAWWGDDRRSKP